jgi:hypothetical protein
MAAARRDLKRHLASDPAPASHHDGDLAAELLFGRHALKLGFLERPVLDPERLGPRQCDVIVKALEIPRLLGTPDLRQHSTGARLFLERVGARHHVDGVDEELRRDTRFALVFAESEQPEARHDDH